MLATVLFSLFLFLSAPDTAFAAMSEGTKLDLTNSNVGLISILLFVIAYIFVMTEEFTHLRKSKPVMLAAGIIWALIAYVYDQQGLAHTVENAVRHNILEFSELMLFLLVAMTYINVLQERLVFDALRAWLIRKNFSYRKLFWMTGILAFFISPIADNLTTALLMCAVVMAVGIDSPKFVSISCVNIVVAANAGGAFSPFGDITTLMVWQKGVLPFETFFLLFIPAVINFSVPAVFMHFAIPNKTPKPSTETVVMKRGAKRIILLFLLTIATAVSFHNYLHLPPMMGMMTGLAFLQFFSFFLKKTHSVNKVVVQATRMPNGGDDDEDNESDKNYDIFSKVAKAEWDTLLFFYGVVLCVGGLGFIGYLANLSELMYVQWGATAANVTVGVLSAVIDNIPVMFAVLNMYPDMSVGQWLLVTLTAGVGGSLLSIGSAAGVALMGQAQGIYTFFSHLKWTPIIALGYGMSIYVHMWINAETFVIPLTK